MSLLRLCEAHCQIEINLTDEVFKNRSFCNAFGFFALTNGSEESAISLAK